MKTAPGQIVKPGVFFFAFLFFSASTHTHSLSLCKLTGDVMVLSEEGMPMHKNPFVKGNLYIKFEIEFPSKLSGDAMRQLEVVLGGRFKHSFP